MASSLSEIQQRVAAFRDERDWEQYHDPKSLVIALTAELGELAEHFLWLTSDESRQLSEEVRAEVGQEMADVALFLLNLANSLDLDLGDEVERKIELNAKRYPTGDSTPHAND
jgi:NTP pyrophosphatase (non-canonical NTP hydrolase)